MEIETLSPREIALHERVEQVSDDLAEALWRPLFNELAKRQGIRPDALDDAWLLSGINAHGQPNSAVIDDALEAQKVRRSYLFTPGPAAEADPLLADLLPDDEPGFNDAGWMITNNEAVVKDAVARQALNRPRPMFQQS